MIDREAAFLSVLKLAADEPARLRRVDVYRVVDAARSRFEPADHAAFLTWLRAGVADRPAMATEIAEVVEELEREARL